MSGWSPLVKRQRRQIMREAGICTRCQRGAADRFALCLKCRRSQTAYWHRRVAERRQG